MASIRYFALGLGLPLLLLTCPAEGHWLYECNDSVTAPSYNAIVTLPDSNRSYYLDANETSKMLSTQDYFGDTIAFEDGESRMLVNISVDYHDPNNYYLHYFGGWFGFRTTSVGAWGIGASTVNVTVDVSLDVAFDDGAVLIASPTVTRWVVISSGATNSLNLTLGWYDSSLGFSNWAALNYSRPNHLVFNFDLDTVSGMDHFGSPNMSCFQANETMAMATTTTAATTMDTPSTSALATRLANGSTSTTTGETTGETTSETTSETTMGTTAGTTMNTTGDSQGTTMNTTTSHARSNGSTTTDSEDGPRSGTRRGYSIATWFGLLTALASVGQTLAM